MSGIRDTLRSFQAIKHLGDPNMLVEYVTGLEKEVKDMRLEVKSLHSLLNEKIASIQCLEALQRETYTK